jgi:hypothetical protein
VLIDEFEGCVKTYNKNQGVITCFRCSRNEHEFLLRYISVPEFQGKQKSIETVQIKARDEFALFEAHNGVQNILKNNAQENWNGLLSDFTVDFNNPEVQFKYLSLMFKCFGFVFNQNLKTHVLLEEQTETLKEQTVTLSLQNEKLLIKLEKIESELEERKRLEQLAEERRLKRRNRKKGFQRVY